MCNLTIFCQFCLDKMGSFLYDDVKVLLNGKKIKQHGFVPCFHFYTLVNRVTFGKEGLVSESRPHRRKAPGRSQGRYAGVPYSNLVVSPWSRRHSKSFSSTGNSLTREIISSAA